MTEISKSDYRALRQIQTEALDRFCADVLRAIEAVSADTALTHHERYLRIYHIIQERNDIMARLFANPRRSQIWLQMFELHQQGYLREADLVGFRPRRWSKCGG